MDKKCLSGARFEYDEKLREELFNNVNFTLQTTHNGDGSGYFSPQPALKKELEEVVVPKQLNKLELLLKENNGGDGFFVGDSVRSAS